MNIVSNIYIGLCLLLPLFFPLQHRNGRAYPFVLLSCAHAMYTVGSGQMFQVDGFTILISLIALWMVVSLFWGDQPHNAVFSCIQWIATFYFLLVAREASIHVVCWEVFAMGCVFAVIQLNELRKSFSHSTLTFFGNPNHNSIYFLLSLHAGLWLMMNVSPWLLPFNILLAIAIVLSGGRAGIIAAIFSVPLVFGLYPLLVTLLVVGGIVTFAYEKDWWGMSPNSKNSIYERIIFCLIAIKLIEKKPLFGWGLEAFRRNVGYSPSTFKEKWEKDFLSHLGGEAKIKTHRVHNDHLELMVELGLIGYILFILPFFLISMNPFYLGVLIAIAVNGLFFFPLREVHISLPFWAFVGVCATSTLAFDPIFIVKGAIILTIIVLAIITFQRFQGLVNYGKLMVSPNYNECLSSVSLALLATPYDTAYLTQAAALSVPKNIMEAFFYSSRAINHYDGETVLWELYHQFATIMIETNSVDIAKWALHQALNLNPNYAPSQSLLQWIEAQGVNQYNRVSIGGM